ncbi:hypothetical protein MGN70_007349 [Eutypa lata]|nr:hypothetical protein MGN70_007349 [Eutypa lata]
MVLSAVEMAQNVLKHWQGEGIHVDKSHTLSSLVYHPDILYTVHVVSEIESRSAKPNLDLVIETRDRIHQRLLSLLGNDSDATIRAQLALGHSYSTPGLSRGHEKNSFKNALDLFQDVVSKANKRYSGPWSFLRLDHPLVLEARREAALARVFVGDMAVACMQKSLKVLQNLAATQQQKMGLSHSQTLQTHMAVLATAVALNNPVSGDIGDDLLSRLRPPEVRSERRVKSLLMEERVAHIYWSGGLFSICKEIFIELTGCDGYVDATSEDEETIACKEIARRAKDSLQDVEKDMTDASRKGELGLILEKLQPSEGSVEEGRRKSTSF